MTAVVIDDALRRVLELARWAPSGDNTQPWRYQVVGSRQLVVHGHDTRDHVVYDLHGRASQLSIGAMLETMAIAAQGESWSTDIQRRVNAPDTQPTFDVRFNDRAGLTPSPLADAILRRAVQRRPLSTRALSAADLQTLQAAVGPEFRLQWLATASERRATARLMFRSARIRLTTPEAYEVHRSVIEWNARHSADKVPDQALGVDAATLKLMRFVMHSWGRVRLFNRFLAGTWVPRLQMDFLPAIACAAHVAIHARSTPQTIDDHVAAGRAVQRFWLQLTRMGLWQQPEMTPLIFAEYVRLGTVFTQQPGKLDEAAAVRRHLTALLGADPQTAVWMGRLGSGSAPLARSVRLPLEQLLLPAP
ncbi:MAG: nitroreductase family protein [Burkholderiales bacterium]|nr:nitroreductase family protein [Burkholderiales bacterium]